MQDTGEENHPSNFHRQLSLGPLSMETFTNHSLMDKKRKNYALRAFAGTTSALGHCAVNVKNKLAVTQTNPHWVGSDFLGSQKTPKDSQKAQKSRCLLRQPTVTAGDRSRPAGQPQILYFSMVTPNFITVTVYFSMKNDTEIASRHESCQKLQKA